jgi:hypothetical protein
MTDELTPDEKPMEAPKSSTPPPATDKFPVDLFITDASHNVSVQGLLAHEPELRTAELSLPEWESKLQAYNKMRIA